MREWVERLRDLEKREAYYYHAFEMIIPSEDREIAALFGSQRTFKITRTAAVWSHPSMEEVAACYHLGIQFAIWVEPIPAFPKIRRTKT